MRTINIFRGGTQTSKSGSSHDYTEEDVQGMVASFNPAVHEPPVRVGHTDNDSVPAYGWIKNVSRNGVNLYAEVDFVEAMEDMIAKGHYRKVSASFYPPNSPANPSPGNYTLKHLAMLGAAAPAVKGLEPFDFSEEDTVTLDLDLDFSEDEAPEEKPVSEEEATQEETPEFSDDEDEDQETLEDDEDETPEVEGEGEIDEEDMPKPPSKKKKKKQKAKKSENYSEEETPEVENKTSELEAKLAEMQKNFSEMQTQLTEAQGKVQAAEDKAEKAVAELAEFSRDKKREEIRARVEALYSEGQLTENIVPSEELFEFSCNLEEGTLDFSEEGVTAADKLLNLLGKLESQVEFSEIVKDEEKPEDKEDEMSFSDKVSKYAEENEVSYEEALREVAKG